ncbi:hypothetical protein NEMBOFW57_008436 [Staphylotrichum longicolle]|uniref:Uncharacterized protein n=1 Tax=Staphylotrichum longicolle TaxID=669026 RepID=A0AAD4EVL5_9PEZI|nr:hypothetical protein NEMBOFW57_008436 [Staphylotrichum longicolle]
MALRSSAQTLLAQATRTALRPAPPTITAPSLTAAARQYHPTLNLMSYKDDQDRQSLKPRRSEGTKSGSDDEVAEKTDAAFNPNKTSPEDEKASAANNGNPLEASGANQEISKPQAPEEPQDKSDKKTKSGGSQGTKHGKVSPK